MFTFKAVPLREEFNYTLFSLVKTAGNTDFSPEPALLPRISLLLQSVGPE